MEQFRLFWLQDYDVPCRQEGVVGGSEQLKGDETVSKQQYVVKITSHYQGPPLVLGKYYFDTEQEAENFISTLRPASKSSDAYQMALTFELLEL